MDSKTVAIIGAGFVGIGSMSHVKAEGMVPVCFEKSDKYGGTWYYRKESKYAQSSIMPTTIINHSKEMGALSSFPPRKEFPNYMKHTQLLQYITDYMNHHDLEKYINYNTEVVHVKRAEDYIDTGRWSVTTRNLVSGKTETNIFDGVLVGTGHINMPIIPTFPGQDIFKGKILHTHGLKEVEEFLDQSVVVVGTGCSALDAAVEISRVAKQVYLSTRYGAYIISRVGPNGYPIDSLLLRRYLTILLDILPTNLISWFLERYYLDKYFDHALYRIKPKYHVLSKDPSLNDHIGSKLLSGAVIQKGNIHHFTENGIVFGDEDSQTQVDSVIMATGYTWGFPFLEDGTIVKEGDMIKLYKCIYPPHLPHPTLAIIGFLNPFGPGFPLGEMQIRFAAYLLAGQGQLPSEDIMMKDIVNRHRENSKRFYPGEKMSIRVDFVQYMDDLAKEIGVKPNLLKFLFTDFPLFLRLVFGPCLSYQYRLEGHGKWKGAREAIMTSDERMQWPLRERKPLKKGFFEKMFIYITNFIPINVHILHY